MKKSINKLIKRIRLVKKHKQLSHGAQHKYYAKRLKTLEVIFDRLYGEDLRAKLFDVYDEHCPDDEMKDVLDYVSVDSLQTSGIEVYAYDFPGVSSEITIKTEPLRIELTGLECAYKEVVWTAAA